MPNRTPHAGKIWITGYSVPVYHEGEKCYVDFFYIDEAEGKKKRKKYHFDGIKNARLRRQQAQQFIFELTARLERGWRPYLEVDQSQRGYTELKDVVRHYMLRAEKTGKAKSLHSYRSMTNIFFGYLAGLSHPPVYASDLREEHIISFMDYLIEVRDVSPRTWNNYRTWLTVFCNYMVRHKYISANLAGGLEKMKERGKFRQPLTGKMLLQLQEYLGREDKYFLLACMMEYYAMIRPGELTRIKIGDITVKNQSIFVSGEISKNGRDSKVALNETVITLMLELGVLTRPGSHYLFSTDMRPGEEKLSDDAFNKRWAKVRDALGWGREYQFYSLKDSGIRDLANEAGIVVARDQARHTDIHTTNKYLCGRDRHAPEAAKGFKGFLG